MLRNITRGGVLYGGVSDGRQLHSADIFGTGQYVLRRCVGSEHEPHGILASSVLCGRGGRPVLRVRNPSQIGLYSVSFMLAIILGACMTVLGT